MERVKVIEELNDSKQLSLARIGMKYGMAYIDFTQKCIDDVLTMLKEQEATGHWISVNNGDTVVIDNDGFIEQACYCSECQKFLIASDEYAVYGRYCPFCGAKMECR